MQSSSAASMASGTYRIGRRKYGENSASGERSYRKNKQTNKQLTNGMLYSMLCCRNLEKSTNEMAQSERRQSRTAQRKQEAPGQTRR